MFNGNLGLITEGSLPEGGKVGVKILMTIAGGATPPPEEPHVRHIRIDATKLARIVWPQNAWVCVGNKADAYYSLCPEGG